MLFCFAVLDKDGNGGDGKNAAHGLWELPEDLQRLIESTTDAAGRPIPMYSKMTANQELRKLYGVGAAGVGADKVRNSLLNLKTA